MGIILEASHLTYGYDESSHAIEDLSIAFEEGKTTAILGANGAGKSTLFLHLNGILQPEQGEVRFRGQPISYKKAGLRQLRSKVGIVFQNPDDQLFSASVYQDISFGAVNMGLPAEEVHRRVETVMEQVGITYLKDRPTHALSFGQKKRVAFAGIMVMQPEVIILDEPTAGLDPVGISELMHLLQDVCRQQHTTIILSTHDIDVVPIYADVIDVMDKGHMVAHGSGGLSGHCDYRGRFCPCWKCRRVGLSVHASTACRNSWKTGRCRCDLLYAAALAERRRTCALCHRTCN